jgi:hypothetical protein
MSRVTLPSEAKGDTPDVSRKIRHRWTSKFARFVLSYGVVRLAARLDVLPTAIYHWVAALKRPRPSHAEMMQRLASECGVRLTLDQIYQHSRDLRARESESRSPSISGKGTPATSFAQGARLM